MSARNLFARACVVLAFLLPLVLGDGVGVMLAAASEQKNLQLEVVINGVPAHMIGSFVLFDGKRIGATRNELEDVGLEIGQKRAPGDIVMLGRVLIWLARRHCPT
jgi:hypothetical protein